MNTKLTALLLLAPLALSTVSAVAQDVPATSQRRRAAPTAVTVSLKFAGGTMAEFVAAVRADQPKANIVLATQARNAQVPAMVLKSAGLEQALEGACMSAAADYDVRVKEFRGTGEPVYSIVAQKRHSNTAEQVHPADHDSQQWVSSLNELTSERVSGIKAMDVATILSAIELALSDEKKAPRLRFHKDSGLLLVRGSREQISVVEQVLGTLSRDMDQQERRQKSKRADEARRAKSSK